MKFKELADYFEKIEKTTSRLEITRVLASLFKKLAADEIDKTVYLLQGRVVPLYEKVNFGMAEKMVIRSIVQGLSLENRLFVRRYKKMGDLGKALEAFKQEIRSFEETDLTILKVYDELFRLATAGGDGSQETKINILSNLIRRLDSLSCRYLVRIPQGLLRLGFSDMTVLDAYSWMISGDKSLRWQIEKAYHVRPDLGFIGHLLKKEGVKSLAHIVPRLFTPILMMRAERLSTAEDIIKQIGRCIIEPKYDGFRLQIHYSHKTKEIRIYSRNLEDVSFMYPDIVAGVRREVKAEEIILEGEAIGYEETTNTFLPFQETVQRKRKYDIQETAKKIPLKLFPFELLYVNGKSFIDTRLEERSKELLKHIKNHGDTHRDVLLASPTEITSDPKKVDRLFEDAIAKGLEGIIAKRLDGVYQAGARGWNWIKFKKSYSSKIEDTIDCLIMGYDAGKGKRTNFGIGAFLVGVYDQKNDRYLTTSKIGTGLTDEEWKELYKRAQKYKQAEKPTVYDVDKMMKVDAWVDPHIVVEIKADEITRSSIHTAGRVLKASKSGTAFEVATPGFALRFPRLVRFRDDKRPEETTTLNELRSLFRQQKGG